MCLWRTLLTEHEVVNNITFSALCTVHDLPLYGRLLQMRCLKKFSSIEKLFSVPLLLGNSVSNFCAMHPLSRYTIFFIIIRSSLCFRHVYSDAWKYIISTTLKKCTVKYVSVRFDVKLQMLFWAIGLSDVVCQKLWILAQLSSSYRRLNSRYFLRHGVYDMKWKICLWRLCDRPACTLQTIGSTATKH